MDRLIELASRIKELLEEDEAMGEVEMFEWGDGVIVYRNGIEITIKEA